MSFGAAAGSTASTQPCWISNHSLVHYDAELYPNHNVLIDYVNISIVSSKIGFRMWNFIFAGNTSLTSFTQNFQLNPDCRVPGVRGGDPTPNQVFFSPKGFKGILIVDNVTYGISNTENNPFQWAWDYKKAVFELTVDLCRGGENAKERDFYVNITIKDGCCGELCGCDGGCGNGCHCTPSPNEGYSECVE